MRGRLAVIVGGVLGAVVVPCLTVLGCSTDGRDTFGETFGPNAGSDARVDDAGTAVIEGGDALGVDAPSEASTPTCAGGGAVAVLAGDDSSMSGAVQVDGGAWSGIAIPSGAAKSFPALAAFGVGFVAVTRGPNDALQAIVGTSSFGAPTSIGAATTIGAPALAASGGTAHVVFLASDNKLFHGKDIGAGWDDGSDPVKPPGGTQSFGPSAPSAVVVGSELLVANDGDDGGLYVQTLLGTSWSAAAPIAGAAVYKPAPPALVATGGGTFDAVVLWVDGSTRRVSYAAREATSKTWSAAAIVDALTVTDEQVRVARVGASGLLLAFRGQDRKGYVASATIGASSLSWTPAVPIVPGGVIVESPPAVSKGTCGDEAIVAFSSNQTIGATRLRQGAWSPVETVTGVSGTRLAVATR